MSFLPLYFRFERLLFLEGRFHHLRQNLLKSPQICLKFNHFSDNFLTQTKKLLTTKNQPKIVIYN